jgi:SnoaL-like domain
MPTTPPSIAAFFQAMQAGASAEQDMAKLFAEDAVYIESFSGAPMTHRGKSTIMNVMRAGWATPLPSMTIELDRVDVVGADIHVAWTCRSPALPGGSGKGLNKFTILDGLIVRLETTLG